MNNNSSARKLRFSILSLAAVAALTLPLVASASAAGKTAANQSLLNAEPRYVTNKDSEALYSRLQNLTHDVCGSSDLRITGDLSRSKAIDECYQGTLTAAVIRLNNPEVAELHNN